MMSDYCVHQTTTFYPSVEQTSERLISFLKILVRLQSGLTSTGVCSVFVRKMHANGVYLNLVEIICAF